MTGWFHSLRVGGVAAVFLAFLTGGAAVAIWMSSTQAWTAHLSSARIAGQLLYDALVYDAPFPDNINAAPLGDAAQSLANAGEFEQMPGLPRPALVTNVSVGTSLSPAFSRPALQVAIVSPRLRFPLSELPATPSPRDTLGGLVALLATYCSDVTVLAQRDGARWQELDAPEVWSCAAQPRDLRIPAILMGIFALVTLASAVLSISGRFTAFADDLNRRQRLAGSAEYKTDGPMELRKIVKAFNTFRDVERQHLSERAMVLSGVTHDLGTPAQRLKLRAALIEDAALRDKLVTDIDQMTAIIESVLTYTRSELSTEEPRRLSLTSLVEAVVEDFSDAGHPVALEAAASVTVEGVPSIFMSRTATTVLPEHGDIVITARPVALRRALTNLIDNAIKYGRRANVRLETTPSEVHILVEDAGGSGAIDKLHEMEAPFQRGKDVEAVAGFGMGLTIVSAIAHEHDGSLSFEPGHAGAVARLIIAR